MLPSSSEKKIGKVQFPDKKEGRTCLVQPYLVCFGGGETPDRRLMPEAAMAT
jgi:hypothetical protein